MIDASHFDANDAYAAAERHQLEDYEPHIYRTRDAGKTWQTITNGLPRGRLRADREGRSGAPRPALLRHRARRVRLVRRRRSLAVAAAQSAGRRRCAISQIKDDDLIVATHGRGFWVLDDITALRQLDATTADADAILFRPPDAVKLPAPSEQGTPLPKDEPSAENPPAGAIIDYYLKSALAGAGGARNPRRVRRGRPPLRERRSRRSRAIRTRCSVQTVWAPQTEPLPATAGMHRWVWDLRGQPANAGGGAAEAQAVAAEVAAAAAAAPRRSARYTVRLTVDGKTYTQPLIVHADPRGGV